MAEPTNVLSFKAKPEFFYARFERALEKNNYIAALEAIRTARDMQPENALYTLELAELYESAGEYTSALHEYTNARRIDGETAGECLFGIAYCLLCMEDYRAAGECFAQYLMVDVNHDNVEEAVEYIEEIQEKLDNAKGRRNERLSYDMLTRGMQYERNGNYVEAIMCYLEASDLDKSGRIEILHMAVECAMSSGYLKEAYDMIDVMLQEDPESVAALCDKIVLMYAAEMPFDAALAQLDKLAPYDADELEIILQMYDYIKMYDRYIDASRMMLEEEPLNVICRLELANVYTKLKRYDDAYDIICEAERIRPKEVYIKNAKKWAEKNKKTPEVRHRTTDFDISGSERLRIKGRLESSIRRPNASRKDENLKNYAEWAANDYQDEMKEAAYTCFTIMDDDFVEGVLRRMLLNNALGLDRKREALIELKKRNARQPFEAIMLQSYAEIKIPENLKDALPGVSEEYEKIGELIVSACDRLMIPDYIETSLQALRRYCYEKERLPEITQGDEPSVALAFLHCGVLARSYSTPDELSEISDKAIAEFDPSIAVMKDVFTDVAKLLFSRDIEGEWHDRENDD